LLLLAACGLSPATAAQILRSEGAETNQDGEVEIIDLDHNMQAARSTAFEQNGNFVAKIGPHGTFTRPSLPRKEHQTQALRTDAHVDVGAADSAAAQLATTAPDVGNLSMGRSQSTSDICAAAMIVILSLTLAILICTQRGRFQNSSKGELLATSCILLYIVVTISADVLIRKFHQQAVITTFLFSPAVITTLVEAGKLIVMIVGAAVDWKNTRKCSLAEFGKTMQLMSIPAACFVALNVIRYGALAGADLDQYRVWRSTDIIFVACIWFAMSKKTPQTKQIAGIGLVCLSCATMHVMHHQDKQSSGEISSVAIITIVSMALLSSLGLVLNDFGLKASTELSLFVQSIALYFLTTVFNSALVLATVPTVQIFQGIGSPQMALIGLDVILGVCVACVLKYADAVVKQLASGWLAPLEPLVGHFLVGTPVTPTMVFGTMLAGFGTIVYKLPETESPKNATAPNSLLLKKKEKEETTEAK